jgi:Fic family protein
MDVKPFGGLSGHRAGVVKLSLFFCDNPGEELSIEDAALKLGVSLRTAATYLSYLAREDGELERVSIYRRKKA